MPLMLSVCRGGRLLRQEHAGRHLPHTGRRSTLCPRKTQVTEPCERALLRIDHGRTPTTGRRARNLLAQKPSNGSSARLIRMVCSHRTNARYAPSTLARLTSEHWHLSRQRPERAGFRSTRRTGTLRPNFELLRTNSTGRRSDFPAEPQWRNQEIRDEDAKPPPEWSGPFPSRSSSAVRPSRCRARDRATGGTS